jgi:ectoine hydroxylase-related dioxygenase (phytanoyl-CoA dioxygenase family)
VELGNALVFNGKINHRGTANGSNADRPVIYRVFHKQWYNDQFRVGIDDQE